MEKICVNPEKLRPIFLYFLSAIWLRVGSNSID
jgi:hypothetical protein